MTDWQVTFAWAFFGSIAGDIIRLRHASDTAQRNLPIRYRQPRFYIISILTALVAGGVAVVEGADKKLLAFEIGVAAPLIVQNLTKKPPALPDE